MRLLDTAMSTRGALVVCSRGRACHSSVLKNVDSTVIRRVTFRDTMTTISTRMLTVSRSGFLDQAWGVGVDQKTLTETIPQNLFACSIIPYIGFLYHLTKSKDTPKLTLFGFYFLLVFVFATIPAGIYAKNVYHTTLANVDYLHGSAEFMLTLTNLFIVLGLQQKIDTIERQSDQASSMKEKE